MRPHLQHHFKILMDTFLETTAVLVRVGVSLISQDQACTNAEEEIPAFDFAGVQKTSFDTWDELLGRIKVGTQGVNSEIVELFYSSFYRTHISPADCKTSCRSRGHVLTLYHRHRRKPSMELH